jgi:hypothetical protein
MESSERVPPLSCVTSGIQGKIIRYTHLLFHAIPDNAHVSK